MTAKEFDQAKWIWCNNNAGKDEYGEFICEFNASSDSCQCRISCDGDYLDFYSEGSSAPMGKFNYLYTEIQQTALTAERQMFWRK